MHWLGYHLFAPWQSGFPFWGISPVIGFSLLGLLIIWSLVWKGMALWRAAQRGEMAWFIMLLVVNTVGILEILYLYVFSNRKSTDTISAPK